jgi:hypothetical protein
MGMTTTFCHERAIDHCNLTTLGRKNCMDKKKKWQEQAAWTLAGFLLGLILAVPVYVSNLFDDAYIHARIVENFLTHGVPFFNTGEKFKAGSSTGYLFLIAALSKVWGVLDAIRYFEAFMIVATITSLFYLAGFSANHRVRNALAAISVIPFFLLAAYGGMETPVVCLLIAGAAIAWRHEKHSLVVFLIAMGTCFRFEVILLLLVVVFYYIYVRKSKKSIVIYAAPLLVLFFVELMIYGSVIPNAARVKSIAYDYPLLDSVLNALTFNFDYGLRGVLFGMLLVLVLGFQLAGMFRKKFKIDFSDVFIILSCGVFASWAIGRSNIFFWYYCLLVFPFGISVLLTDDASSVKKGRQRVFEGRALESPHLPLEVSTSTQNEVGQNPETLTLPLPLERLVKGSKIAVLIGFTILGAKAVLPEFGFLGNDRILLRVGRYLNIGTELYSFCPSCTLVTSEIGGLGYSFKGKVYDAFGLGDPEAVRFHPMKVPEERQGYSIGAIPPRYVEYRNPDFIVSMPIFSQALRRSAVINSYIAYDCPFSVEVGSIFGDKKIQVFSKTALPAHTFRAMGCEIASESK